MFSQQTITFQSKDSLTITADLYMPHAKTNAIIILFHQAGFSRGEYKETAPKLNALGYNCIAIDQRSGGEVNGVINETNQNALKQGKGTSYLDALVDVESAIDYVKKNYKEANQLILLGSSYSASLVLKMAGDRTDIDAVISFSPGEYFENLGETSDYIKKGAQNILIPVFITSSKTEKKDWWNIYSAIPSIGKDYFLPKTEGQHGSRVLWEEFPEHEDYWKAVKAFLKMI